MEEYKEELAQATDRGEEQEEVWGEKEGW